VRIALVDDDAKFRSQTVRLLEIVLEERHAVADVVAFESAESLLTKRDAKMFDVYLLDVIMPGMDGISLARRIRADKPDAPIVFFTTSRDFAVEAFGVHAADYLIKPFARETFAETINRVLRQLTMIKPPTLLLKVSDGIVKLSPRDLVFVKADGRHQVVHVLGGQSYTTRLTLQELEEKLRDDERFVRVGRQLLVNLAQVKKYADGTLLLSNGVKCAIPRRSLVEVKSAFARFYGA